MCRCRGVLSESVIVELKAAQVMMSDSCDVVRRELQEAQVTAEGVGQVVIQLLRAKDSMKNKITMSASLESVLKQV